MQRPAFHESSECASSLVWPRQGHTLGVSQLGATFSFISNIISGGVLGFPFCFSRCGLVLGTVLLVCTALSQTFTLKQLVYAATVTRSNSVEEVSPERLTPPGPHPHALPNAYFGACLGRARMWLPLPLPIGPGSAHLPPLLSTRTAGLPHHRPRWWHSLRRLRDVASSGLSGRLPRDPR